ncbi:hypothetical protein FN846DRAFT_886138 [Sphaerosporella brunnea]|uniref:Uncharacterized protein n=1 Tax=Sphaerosporella brunnea TaxID=1250544 RepID=A0A5J5F9H8_9PEZI|nr:hypothetical protein FN846DRAFT_886138 [Sphaerosporella brunnea]
MSEAKAMTSNDSALLMSECHPRATGPHIPMPVLLDRDDVLTEMLMTMVHNADDDLSELSQGKCWRADVRYPKHEQFVVAPIGAAFAAAMARERAGFANQKAAVGRQGVESGEGRKQKSAASAKKRSGCERQKEQQKTAFANGRPASTETKAEYERGRPIFATENATTAENGTGYEWRGKQERAASAKDRALSIEKTSGYQRRMEPNSPTRMLASLKGGGARWEPNETLFGPKYKETCFCQKPSVF